MGVNSLPKTASQSSTLTTRLLSRRRRSEEEGDWRWWEKREWSRGERYLWAKLWCWFPNLFLIGTYCHLCCAENAVRPLSGNLTIWRLSCQSDDSVWSRSQLKDTFACNRVGFLWCIGTYILLVYRKQDLVASNLNCKVEDVCRCRNDKTTRSLSFPERIRWLTFNMTFFPLDLSLCFCFSVCSRLSACSDVVVVQRMKIIIYYTIKLFL